MKQLKQLDDYEDQINLQGSWGYSPTTPLVDQQTKDIAQPQLAIHLLVEETIQGNLLCRSNTSK